MATTTVKISDRANRKLDALQARMRLRSGKRLTKQAILEDLVNRALATEEPLAQLPPPRYPLPAKVRRLLRTYPLDWGVETTEEAIDEILYGAKR